MVNDPSLFTTFLVSTLLPVLIALIFHQRASDTVKAIISFLVCCAVAFLVMWLSDKFLAPREGLSTNETLKLYVENAGLCLMTAWGFYARFWSKLGVTEALNSAGLKVGRPSI
jgi:Na+(H+)/acetate symporter ActP